MVTMSRPKLKPRVIRKVIKNDAKGRAKVARDRKINVTMERMTARTNHLCHYHACPWDKVIESKTEYAAITRLDAVRRIGSNMVPAEAKRFHFDCVPPETRPLVRLLVPCNWRMTMITDSDQRLIIRWFTGPTPWVAWLNKNHPDLIQGFHFQNNEVEQFGTNYYWSVLKHKPRFQKP